MWDVLSGDFDQSLSPEQCLKNVIDAAGRGSIIVLHDSLKAEPRLRYALPRILEHFSKRGYRFEAIPMQHEAEATTLEESSTMAYS
jgi:peptidoglycan/xylan/chitin deacetylase (PgdA/CDA1 family)